MAKNFGDFSNVSLLPTDFLVGYRSTTEIRSTVEQLSSSLGLQQINNLYSTLNSNSGNWQNTYNSNTTNAPKWNSVYTTVHGSSAYWNNFNNNLTSYLASNGVTLSSMQVIAGCTLTGSISGNNATASFNSASATGTGSFAVNQSKTFGMYSLGAGYGTVAAADYGSVLGYGSIAGGTYSHAQGLNTEATGIASHAQGANTDATGNYAHAEGLTTVASGPASHAEGLQTAASGAYAHAEGFETDALGDFSHAQGFYATASGPYSHAQNGSTFAAGSGTHAQGYYTRAIGNYSHAAGMYAEARHDRCWIWKGSTDLNTLSTTRTDQFMVSAAGGMYVPGNLGVGVEATSCRLRIDATGNIIIDNLPTSSAGLPAGALYVDSGFLKVA